MITNDGDYSVSIQQTDPHRHKYNDAMSEYMDHIGGMRMLFDTTTGESDAPMGHVALFGKRLLFHDERGFVCHDKYPSNESAQQVYYAIDAWYGEWADDEWDMGGDLAKDEYEHENQLALREAYVRYVIACATENLNAHDYDMWLVHNQPKGPLGLCLTVRQANMWRFEDWRYEVANGDTWLGFDEWCEHSDEMEWEGLQS